MAVVVVGGAGLGMMIASNFLPMAANAVGSAVATAGVYYFGHEALNFFGRYSEKISQIKEPTLSERYLKFLPQFNRTDEETISAAKAYVDASHCQAMTPPDRVLAILSQPTRTPNTNHTADRWVDVLHCPGETGRLHTVISNSRRTSYETCLRIPALTVEACNEAHYGGCRYEMSQLRSDLATVQDVVSLNKRHEGKAQEYKTLCLENAVYASISLVTALACAVRSCFSRCCNKGDKQQ